MIDVTTIRVGEETENSYQITTRNVHIAEILEQVRKRLTQFATPECHHIVVDIDWEKGSRPEVTTHAYVEYLTTDKVEKTVTLVKETTENGQHIWHKEGEQ